jgi:hypothetical protein
MDKPEPKMWYENYQNKLQAEQAGKSSQEVEEMLSNKVDDLGQTVYSTVFNPNNPPTQGHRWVDRGAKMSCEHAGHPHHSAFKRGGKMM